MRILTVSTLLLVLLAADGRAMGERDAVALAAMATLADGRRGAVCWQSRRTGSLRIFCCDLDGQNLRQVSPDVSGRDHLGPLISPDGTRVLYYDTIFLTDANYYADHSGNMMVVDIDDTDGSSALELVSGVRTYFECRFARWIDNDRIAYIGTDHDGYEYSISQDQSTRMFDYPVDDFGAIPNRQYTHAIDGKNRVFTIHDPGPSGTLTEEQDYDGCEGNMSWDGLWAYRVKGGWPGHDFYRMRLGSWEEEMFFANLNPALPADQNYIYFPQLSLCQGFLSLGVSRSRDEHDHWTSDYDIFVAPIDPATFQMTGDPVKYSFADELDSYPDIWVEQDAPPEIAFQPAQVQFDAVLGGSNPADRTVHVTNAGGGTLDTAVCTENASWLQVNPSGGGNGQDLVNSVDIAGLAADTYDTIVEVDVPNAVNSPRSYAVTLTVSELALPLRINCGDNAYDVTGWQRDDPFVSGGQDWVNPNDIDTSGVTNAAPHDVYKSVRHQSPHAYQIGLPDGDYLLRLHFADAYTDRAMDYFAEGVHILDDLDVVTEAGGTNRALVKEFGITVTGGDGLQIEASSDGDVFECGIEILQPPADEPPVDAGDAGSGEPDAGPLPDGGDAARVDAGDAMNDAGLADDDIGITGACGCSGVSTDGAFLAWGLLALLVALRRRMNPIQGSK